MSQNFWYIPYIYAELVLSCNEGTKRIKFEHKSIRIEKGSKINIRTLALLELSR